MLRKPLEVLDATGLEAVTEFNQWLRGLDATAIRVWQTASDEARDASAQGTRVAMFFVGISAAVLALALMLLSQPTLSVRAMVIVMLAGIGAFLSIAGHGVVRSAKQRHDEAARTLLMLEYKLGFLHGQLEGDHVSPSGNRPQDAQRLLDGTKRVRGYAARGMAPTLMMMAFLHIFVASVVTWGALS